MECIDCGQVLQTNYAINCHYNKCTGNVSKSTNVQIRTPIEDQNDHGNEVAVVAALIPTLVSAGGAVQEQLQDTQEVGLLHNSATSSIAPENRVSSMIYRIATRLNLSIADGQYLCDELAALNLLPPQLIPRR